MGHGARGLQPDNDGYRRLVAWCWSTPSSRRLVVVNLSDAPAQARVHVPWGDELRASGWSLSDPLTGQSFERDGDELADDGLYVSLDPWASHFLAVTARTAQTAAADANAAAV